MAGVAVGFSFDFYRALRRWLGLGPILTFAGDVIYSLGALFVLIIFFSKANFLAFRFYMVWGSLLGLFLYLRLFSLTVTRILLRSFFLFQAGVRAILGLLAYPYQALVFLMRPPFVLLRWFSLLIYRSGEAVVGWPAKNLGRNLQKWWDRHFPPRTNG